MNASGSLHWIGRNRPCVALIWAGILIVAGVNLDCSKKPPDVNIQWGLGWEERGDAGHYVVSVTVVNRSSFALHGTTLYVKVGGVTNSAGEIVSFPGGQGELRELSLGTIGAGEQSSQRVAMLTHERLEDARRASGGSSPDPVPVAMQVVCKEGRSEKVWGTANAGAPVPPWLNRTQ